MPTDLYEKLALSQMATHTLGGAAIGALAGGGYQAYTHRNDEDKSNYAGQIGGGALAGAALGGLGGAFVADVRGTAARGSARRAEESAQDAARRHYQTTRNQTPYEQRGTDPAYQAAHDAHHGAGSHAKQYGPQSYYGRQQGYEASRAKAQADPGHQYTDEHRRAYNDYFGEGMWENIHGPGTASWKTHHWDQAYQRAAADPNYQKTPEYEAAYDGMFGKGAHKAEQAWNNAYKNPNYTNANSNANANTGSGGYANPNPKKNTGSAGSTGYKDPFGSSNYAGPKGYEKEWEDLKNKYKAQQNAKGYGSTGGSSGGGYGGSTGGGYSSSSGGGATGTGEQWKPPPKARAKGPEVGTSAASAASDPKYFNKGTQRMWTTILGSKELQNPAHMTAATEFMNTVGRPGTDPGKLNAIMQQFPADTLTRQMMEQLLHKHHGAKTASVGSMKTAAYFDVIARYGL